MRDTSTNKIGRTIVNFISFIPLAWVSVLYLFTLLCWLKLGHFPIPSLDDPKSIGFPGMYLLTIFGLFIAVFTLLIWLISLPLTIYQKLLTKKNGMLMIIGGTLMLVQLTVDVFDLINWLLD